MQRLNPPPDDGGTFSLKLRKSDNFHIGSTQEMSYIGFVRDGGISLGRIRTQGTVERLFPSMGFSLPERDKGSLLLKCIISHNWGEGVLQREEGSKSERRSKKKTMSMMNNNNVDGQFGDTKLTKVFVGGLPWETPKETLRDHFEKFGEILEAVIISDKLTGRSKGYGFVSQ
ncbi:putative RNA-binding protein ARP1, partial [Mucuna pruriens]